MSQDRATALQSGDRARLCLKKMKTKRDIYGTVLYLNCNGQYMNLHVIKWHRAIYTYFINVNFMT